MDLTDIVTSAPFAVVCVAATIGWVITTWLRVCHGDPLEGSWGQALKPVVSTEHAERIRLLTAENAEMSAELSAIKERLVTLERIATGSGSRLAHGIEQLNH